MGEKKDSGGRQRMSAILKDTSFQGSFYMGDKSCSQDVVEIGRDGMRKGLLKRRRGGEEGASAKKEARSRERHASIFSVCRTMKILNLPAIAEKDSNPGAEDKKKKVVALAIKRRDHC